MVILTSAEQIPLNIYFLCMPFLNGINLIQNSAMPIILDIHYSLLRLCRPKPNLIYRVHDL